MRRTTIPRWRAALGVLTGKYIVLDEQEARAVALAQHWQLQLLDEPYEEPQ